MPIEVTKDGRTIRTKRSYSEFRYALWNKQEGRCVNCGRDTYLAVPIEWDNAFHVHHKNGRGMGGSKRDDTFESCKGWCGKCHRIEHGQQR